MFSPLKNVLVLVLILFIFLLFNLSKKYYQNSFKVMLNNKDIYVSYHEEFLRGPLPPIIGACTGKYDSNGVTPVVNEIAYNKITKLVIEEYSVYWKDSDERTYDNKSWPIQDRFDYKREKLSNTKLIIKRKSNVIYDGVYVEDISKYINGPGRYYFQVFVIRKDDFYIRVKTHMSFNVIVGGGNRE